MEYDCRQAFEKWAKTKGYNTKRMLTYDEYFESATGNAWLGFQEAWKQCSNTNIQQQVQPDSADKPLAG